jgi:hypothetical protein
MSELLSPEELRAARLVSEGERDRKTGEAAVARALAESIYRDLGGSMLWSDENKRWIEAKARALRRLNFTRTAHQAAKLVKELTV